MNRTTTIGKMADWIGRDLEKLRKLRGLRREDVAAQLPVPVSPSTIRNIEHDEHYNVSLELLRQIATVLGAKLHVTLETTPERVGEELPLGKRVVDNEYLSDTSVPVIPIALSPIPRLAEGCGALRRHTAHS